jgi:hypothetical protein
LRTALSCSRRCAARTRGLGAWAGQTARPPSARNREMSDSIWRVVRE